jgi:hypothetical protein
MRVRGISRRDLLRIAAAAGAGEVASVLLPGCGALRNAASTVTSTSSCSW